MADRPDDRILHTAWTRRFLDGSAKLLYTEVVTRFYPDGTTVQLEPSPVYGPADAPIAEPCGDRFVATYPLYRYRFGDGREYREILQIMAMDQNGRQTYLLALEDARGRWIIDSFWNAAEIAARNMTFAR